MSDYYKPSFIAVGTSTPAVLPTVDDLIDLLDNSERMLTVVGGGTSWVLEHVAIRALVVKDMPCARETDAIKS